MSNRGERFLPSLAFAALLWLPLLFHQILEPYPWNHVAASPVLRRAVEFAALLWLGTAGIAALSACMGARFHAARSGNGETTAVPLAATLASLAMLWLLQPLHAGGEKLGLGSVLGLLAIWGAGGLLGTFVALGLSLALPRGRERLAAAGCGLALGAWVLSVATRFPVLASHPGWLVLAGIAAALVVVVLRGLDPGRFPRLAPGAALALGLALPLAVVATTGAPTPARRGGPTARPEGRVNVLMVLVDTMRADHTSVGGFPLDTTPGLRQLIREHATLFTQASSVGAATQPSVKALFTSQAPSHWGWPAANDPPPPGVWTMARAFRDAGYRTAAFSTNGVLDREGFRAGFDEVVTLGAIYYFLRSPFLYEFLSGGRDWAAFRNADRLRVHKETARTLADLARRWLANDPEAPFFLYVHLNDPHWPYYARGFGLIPEALRDISDPVSHVDLLGLSKGAPTNARLRTAPGIREMSGRYDEEIRLADESIGRLFEALQELGLDDSTLLVVTGDHGEEFFEHLGFGHGHDVFEEQVHVPLILRWPDRPDFAGAPRRVDVPVSLADVLPTLTDLLDLPSPPGPILGRSLRPLIEGRQDGARSVPVVSSASFSDVRLAAYREGDLKVRFLYSRFVPLARARKLAVFDLARDPREQSPLPAHDPRVAGLVERARHHLRDRLSPAREVRAREQREPVQDEALEQLRSLGYVE